MSVLVKERLERLRSLVQFMEKGEDKDALLSMFSEMERLGEDIRLLKQQRRSLKGSVRKLREENRRVSGALRLAKYGLEIARRRIDEQQGTIDWLRRRVGRRKDLQPYEKEQLDSISNEERLKDGS